MPNATTVSDLLNSALTGEQPEIQENEIAVACRSCDRHVPLDTCTMTAGHETSYACPICGDVLVILSAPEDPPWRDRGYPFGEVLVRNAGDIVFREVVMPASPNALATRRPTG
jgi:predicted RNA-binding Zn-ribbon protein involved in translation (DUF1610 family)